MRYLGYKVVYGSFLELAQPYPGVAGLNNLAANRLGADFFAGNGHRKSPVFILAENGQEHLGLGFAAHLLDGLIQAQSLDSGVINAGDQVIGLKSRLVSGRAFNG